MSSQTPTVPSVSTATISEHHHNMPDNETLEWMEIEELEKDIPEEDWKSLGDTIRRVNLKIADDLERNRRREAADFADVQNLVVGNEMTR